MDPKIGTKINPVIIPRAPLLCITKMYPNSILTKVPIIITKGNILVSSDEITIERNKVINAVDVIKIMDKISNEKSILNV